MLGVYSIERHKCADFADDSIAFNEFQPSDMISILHALHQPAWKKIASIGMGVFILWLMAVCIPLLADGTTPSTAQAPPPASNSEDFGQYLADHEEDLSPFFTKHNDELTREGVPLVMLLIGRIVILTLIAGWVVDVLLSRCFSAFFAPAYAKLKRAVLYASVRLAISLACMLLVGFLIFLTLGVSHLIVVSLILVILLFLIALGGQVWWVAYLYRMGWIPAGVFYLALIAVHSVIAVVVSAPIIGTGAPQLWLGFMDRNITSKLQDEIVTTKHELADVSHARDEVKGQVEDTQNRLAQAVTRQQDLQKEIEEKKNSETYIFSQIAKVRASGNWIAARDQLTDFIAKFPNGTLIDSAKTQLTQVNADLATQEAQKKQAEADAATAAAQARADLLSRASKGQVTLSEMRQALIGKTPAQVSELFGPPVETNSNRWGYGQKMILNPLTGEKFGLTVNFAEGAVQGVDYYYGKGSQ